MFLLKTLPPLLLLAVLADGQALVGQKCSALDYSAVRARDQELFGKWYLYAQYRDSDESSFKCSVRTFSEATYGAGNILVTSENWDASDGRRSATQWTLERDVNSTKGRFKTNPVDQPGHNRALPSYDVTVLHIDHRIAIMWYCVTQAKGNQTFQWQLLHILTKVMLPSQGLQNHIYTVQLLSPALKKDKIKKVDQSNCTETVVPQVIVST